MADRYVVVPAHVVAGIEQHEQQEAAAVAAANAVAKDKVPRVVVRLHTEIRAAQQPRVDIVHLS